MITRRGFAGVLLGGVAVAAIGGCGPRGPDKVFRYKMTVEVETPQGVRSDLSVRELRFFESSGGPSIAQSRSKIKLIGEAVAIDLNNGSTLFALLTGSDGDVDYASRIADRSGLWNLEKPRAANESMELWPNMPETEGLANTSAVPMLVTFKDISDPASVALVDPDDLAASFGPGYKLKAITVEVTDEPVTAGIGRVSEELGLHKGQGLDRTKGVTANPTLAQQLGYSDFVRGQTK